MKVVLPGSSPLLIQSGLTESLAGRLETIPVPHWSLAEMQDAFGWDLEKYLLFGAYPGAAPLADDPDRWRQSINDALIETTLSRDILLLTRVDKPALLRRMFQLACAYSGQILAYQKMPVRLTLLGVRTRKALLGCFWFSIVMTVALIIWGGWLGSLAILAAVMYGWALKWMDKHGDWHSPRG